MEFENINISEGYEPLDYRYCSTKNRDWRNGWDEYQEDDFLTFGDIPISDERRDSENDNEHQEHLLRNKIGREVDDFVHGRTKYIKGKGWQSNDN